MDDIRGEVMIDLASIKELSIGGVKLRELSVGGTKVWQRETGEKNYFDAKTASLNYRINSNGGLTACNGIVSTDYIPVDSSMDGRIFKIEGAPNILHSEYKYYTRTAYYTADKTYSKYITTNKDNGGQYNVSPTYGLDGATNAFIRIAITIKDNVSITAEDVAGIKITLK